MGWLSVSESPAYTAKLEELEEHQRNFEQSKQSLNSLSELIAGKTQRVRDIQTEIALDPARFHARYAKRYGQSDIVKTAEDIAQMLVGAIKMLNQFKKQSIDMQDGFKTEHKKFSSLFQQYKVPRFWRTGWVSSTSLVNAYDFSEAVNVNESIQRDVSQHSALVHSLNIPDLLVSKKTSKAGPSNT